MSELIILHGCATIQLTKGLNTLVDERDWVLLLMNKWLASLCYDSYYARRDSRVPGKRWESIHQVVYRRAFGDIPKGHVVDHKSRDTLDNCRDNLRLATQGQNSSNARKKEWRGKTRSQFKGVSWRTQYEKWRAVIVKDGKQYELGIFANEEDAARAYNAAAIKMFGEFARINEGV